MTMFISWLRRGILAATLWLGALVSCAAADVTVAFDAGQGVLLLGGLEEGGKARLLSEPSRVKLHVAGLGAAQGTPITLTETTGGLQIAPLFSLRAGTDYELRLDLKSGPQILPVSLPAVTKTPPRLVGFAPSQSVIPANTLRLYLSFSEPMARGSLREAVTLHRADGTPVDDPFLTLGPELWDIAQMRATLLFDPGRIKQGVGPNISHGPPLVAGESYHLMVDGSLKSAAGVPLGKDVRVALRVGPAETRAIAPSTWHIGKPKAKGREPLTLTFDRIMDIGPLHRLITLHDPSGNPVAGRLMNTDGGGWSYVPDHPWDTGSYTIRINPALEDISGNAVHRAFDAPQGTIGSRTGAVALVVEIN